MEDMRFLKLPQSIAVQFVVLHKMEAATRVFAQYLFMTIVRFLTRKRFG